MGEILLKGIPQMSPVDCSPRLISSSDTPFILVTVMRFGSRRIHPHCQAPCNSTKIEDLKVTIATRKQCRADQYLQRTSIRFCISLPLIRLSRLLILLSAFTITSTAVCRNSNSLQCAGCEVQQIGYIGFEVLILQIRITFCREEEECAPLSQHYVVAHRFKWWWQTLDGTLKWRWKSSHVARHNERWR